MKFLSFRERSGHLTTSHIKRNNRYIDPSFVLNGDSFNGPGGDSAWALMYSISDPGYVGTQPILPGANIGKNAAGQLMRFYPSQADALSIIGSDGSTDSIAAGGWWMNTYANGSFTLSNWLMSVILVNPSTANYGVIVGVRFYQGQIGVLYGLSLSGIAQSLQSPQYAADSFQTGGVAQSLNFQFSVSISGHGAGGAFVLSQNLALYEEFFVKITTASNKSGAKVQIRTDG